MWSEDPYWLKNRSEWTIQSVIQPLLGSQKEAELEKQIVVNTIEIDNAFDNLLEKSELNKALRLSAWVNRLECHHSKQSSPLTTSGIEKQRKFYIKGEQKRLESSEKFQQVRKSTNLVQNTEGMYECRSRIQGSCPIYFPKESLLTEKLFWAAHKKTMPGVVRITMSNIRTY